MAARYVVGIDEVGRGSLAGPVVVAAALIPRGARFRLSGYTLRDSKKLRPHHREDWFKYFKNHPRIRYAMAKVHPRVIDRVNISRAANLAALRALLRLSTSYQLQSTSYKVFLDGGLYLGNRRGITQNRTRNNAEYFQRLSAFSPRVSATTVIRGDEKITAIKIASIIAKVHRDRLMGRLAKKFPEYGLEIHKGYGTRRHREAIRKYGPCAIHRLTFV